MDRLATEPKYRFGEASLPERLGVCKVATTVEEVCKLVEAGFEYICDINDAKVFKKRK